MLRQDLARCYQRGCCGHMTSAPPGAHGRARRAARERLALSTATSRRAGNALLRFVDPTSRAHASVDKVAESAEPAVLRRISV